MLKSIIMIRPLRKRHFQIWVVLAIILPAGIISGWQAIKLPVKNSLLQPSPSAALPVNIENIGKPNYATSLRASTDKSSWQLEWINNAELTAPSAIIYQTKGGNDKIEDGDIIGRIEGRGVFHFPLKKDTSGNPFHFVLYDIIHHQVIDRINFKE
jgi:hypothetical protein